jgi:sialic acid synthase SpsE
MQTIADAFNVIVGYSDHTIGDHIPIAATAMGAKVIEKHYTLNRNMDGPDHSFAIEPAELKEMIYKIREVEQSFGNGMKNGPRKEEMEMFKKARRSLHARKDIKAGEKLLDSTITIKRPGHGIHPFHINLVLGRVAKCVIKKDEPITWNKI